MTTTIVLVKASLIIAVILSLISIGIFIAIKKANHEKKLNVVATFYDGASLYYFIDTGGDEKNNTRNDIIESNNNCLNGGIPNIKNDTFSECNCPDDKFIGPLCQYQNLMRPADGMTFQLI